MWLNDKELGMGLKYVGVEYLLYPTKYECVCLCYWALLLDLFVVGKY